MKTFNSCLLNCAEDKFLRVDEKYYSALHDGNFNLFLTDNNVNLSDVLEEDYCLCPYVEDVEYKGIPTGQSYVDEDGEIIDYQIVTKDNHPGRLKYTVNQDNILLSSLRLAKSPALNFNYDKLDEYVFSNGYYIFRVKTGWDKRFVLYLLRSKKLKTLLDENIYRGIGISSYRLEDLFKIEVKKLTIEEQQNAVARISPIEKQIADLKGNIKDIQGIVDEVLINYYHINFELLSSINSMQQMDITLAEMLNNNKGFRTSFRFNKALLIQDFLEESISPFLKLGQFIISTKNGWSPQCYEDELKYKVLGIDAVRKNTKLSFANLKFTNEEIANMNDYFIKDGDFFVSRGNTTDLVALASIADKEEILENTIYPDLMIKVEFDGRINKQYMAYIFNSFIGRLYFKYATKGKNQTMVKVSERELLEFRVPIPNLCEQQRIVDEIQAEIDKQNEIKNQIAILRMEIDKIVESAAGLSEN